MKRDRVLATASLLTLSAAMLHAQATAPRAHWVATWATSEQMAVTQPDRPVLPPSVKMPDFAHMKGVHGPPKIPSISGNQTLRFIVHTSIPGRTVRIELSNAFDQPVVAVGEAHIALRRSESSIVPSSDRPLTFSGRRNVDIRPGQVILSDPVELDVQPMSDLAVSLFITQASGVPTNHTPGLHTTYLSPGNTTAAESMPSPELSTSYLWLRSVDVAAAPGSFAIACLGDSITDGFRTTVDADMAWPTLLAKRFAEGHPAVPVAVLNAGISGNQVLRDGAGASALARFDRDVSSEPGVRWVVLLEGINDINIHGQIIGPNALTPEDLIAGYKQIIERAHLLHLNIMGATLTPDEGVWLSGPTGEATRQAANQWIRSSGAFDAIVDFDAATRDPANPKHIRAEFDSGDHIHPNDAGNAAMANAFDLQAFTHNEAR